MIMYNELLQQFTAFTGQDLPLDDMAALLVNVFMIKEQYEPTGSPKEQLDAWKQHVGEYNFAYKRNSFTYDLTIIKSSFSKLQMILKGSNRTVKGELDIAKYLQGIQLDNLKEGSLMEFDAFMSRTIKNEIQPKLVFQPQQSHVQYNQSNDKFNDLNLHPSHHGHQIAPPNELFLNINNNVIGQPGYNPQPFSGNRFISPRLDGNLMGPSSFNPQPRMPNLMPRYDPLTPFGSAFDFAPIQDANNNNIPHPNMDLDPFGDPFNVKKSSNPGSNPFPKFL